jgi:hypothetical protein
MISRIRTAFLGLATVGMLAGPAGAQLSLPTFTNLSNPDELSAGSASNASFERESSVSKISSVSGAFTSRYISLVTTDADGTAAGHVEALTSDYEIDFSATAPGAYVLTVDTSISGDLNLVNDSTHGAQADIGAVSGSQTGGTVASGTLSLPDPGIASSAGGGSVGISNNDSATIFGISNGLPVAHTLRFTFSQVATTDATGGDEAAIRLGDTSHVATETAGDYPGSPSRVQTDDGHFVTVTFTSLCGNGTIDSGPSYVEECDLGPANGQPNSCCNSDCTAVTAGGSCTPDSNPCTADVCDGSGVCTHPPGNDGDPCDDGNACTSGTTCAGGSCNGGTAVGCPICQFCDTVGGCQVGPRQDCKHSTVVLKSKFQMKNGTTPAQSVLSYKWVKGAVTQNTEFGDPVNTDPYGLCVFAPNKVLQMIAPAGGTCGTKPCWKVLGIKGFSYKDSLRTNNGIDKIVLKAGLDGKAKTQLKGKGANLPTLPLPLTLPAIVQLQSPGNACFEATFDTPGMSQNDGTQFKGKATN